MACVESISHLYRSLLPISVWVAFFLNDSNTVFSCITAGFYLTIKLSQQLSIISSTVSVWRACLLQEVVRVKRIRMESFSSLYIAEMMKAGVSTKQRYSILIPVKHLTKNSIEHSHTPTAVWLVRNEGGCDGSGRSVYDMPRPDGGRAQTPLRAPVL